MPPGPRASSRPLHLPAPPPPTPRPVGCRCRSNDKEGVLVLLRDPSIRARTACAVRHRRLHCRTTRRECSPCSAVRACAACSTLATTRRECSRCSAVRARAACSTLPHDALPSLDRRAPLALTPTPRQGMPRSRVLSSSTASRTRFLVCPCVDTRRGKEGAACYFVDNCLSDYRRLSAR